MKRVLILKALELRIDRIASVSAPLRGSGTFCTCPYEMYKFSTKIASTAPEMAFEPQKSLDKRHEKS